MKPPLAPSLLTLDSECERCSRVNAVLVCAMAFEERHATYADGNKSIFYVAAGPKQGPLIIFIHGWPDISNLWTEQLKSFAGLGFYAVAPDLPGHGRSTASHALSDYSQENIVTGMKVLLAQLGQANAIWVGHDWGCGVVGTLCATSPQLVRAAVFTSVPYRTIELGLEELLRSVNRDIYPAEKYPWAQWSYQVHYLKAFASITAFYDSNPAGWLKLCHRVGSPEGLGLPVPQATIAEDGGPGGGPTKMPKPPNPGEIPQSALNDSQLAIWTEAFEQSGFFGTNALYMHHDSNRKYNIEKAVNDARLEFPVLYVEAKYDHVLGASVSTITKSQKELCTRLTEVTIDSGHWVQLEKPHEYNAAISNWLAEELSE